MYAPEFAESAGVRRRRRQRPAEVRSAEAARSPCATSCATPRVSTAMARPTAVGAIYRQVDPRDFNNTLPEVVAKLGAGAAAPINRARAGCTATPSTCRPTWCRRSPACPSTSISKLHIFRPLGMTSTRYTILPDRPGSAAARGAVHAQRRRHASRARRTRRPTGSTAPPGRYKPGSFGLVSTHRRLHEVRAHVVRRRQAGPRAHPQARDRASSWPPTPCRRKSPTSPGCPARARWASASTSPCASRRRRMRRKLPARWANSSGTARPARLFWVDPKNDIAAVLFTQMRPFDKVHLHKTFRDAVYRNDPIALAH